MEEETLAMLNRLKKNGGVGYTEKNVFTYDGSTDGKISLKEDVGVQYTGPFYKISSKVPDFSTIINVKANVYGQEVEVFGESCRSEYTVGGIETLYAVLEGNRFNMGAIVHEVPSDVDPKYKGLYFICNAGNYVSYMEFAETVHPIDPKYLPGVEVIDLDECGITPVMMQLIVAGGGTADNPAEDIPRRCKPGRQYVLRFDLGEGIYADICPSYYHYNAAGQCWGIGFSATTNLTGTSVKVDGVITQAEITTYVTPLE